MNAELFSEAMSLIDESYITEALNYRPQEKALPRWRSIAACILLGLFLTGTLVLAFSPEARAAVLGWTRRGSGYWYEYRFEGSQPHAESADYAPTWVPEGYQLTDFFDSGRMKVYFYETAQGQAFSILCHTNMQENEGGIGVSTEGCDEKEVTINGLPGILYRSHDEAVSSGLIWSDDALGNLFIINGFLSEEDMIRCAECVLPVEKVPLTPSMYAPSWVPEDFTLLDTVSDELTQQYVYSTGADGYMAAISCLGHSVDGEIRLYSNSTDSQQIPVTVNGLPGTLYLPHDDTDSREIVWEDPENQLLFTVKARVSPEILIRIAGRFVPMDSPAQRAVQYSPAWVPDGFALHSYSSQMWQETFSYRNAQGASLVFEYEIATHTSRLVSEGPHIVQKEIEICGCPATLCLSSDPESPSLLVWFDEENTMFSIDGPLSEQEIIQMAEGICRSP